MLLSSDCKNSIISYTFIYFGRDVLLFKGKYSCEYLAQKPLEQWPFTICDHE